MALAKWKETNFKRGARSKLLRPLCWLFGHGIYEIDVGGWSRKKHLCPRCGAPTDPAP